MVFASPIWLLGLLPWAMVGVYLLPGRGTPAAVPFLWLWKGSVAVSRRRARRLPGADVLFALLATLLALLAAAEPSWLGGAVDGDFSIVLDRGASMSLPSASGKPFRNVISRLGFVADNARVHLVPVPGQGIETSGNAWTHLAESMPPTAVTTQLDQVVANQLRQTAGPVFVLSDQRLNLTDPRMIRIDPEPVSKFVAITAVGARSFPRPQVMVRLENHSDLSTVTLSIQSGDVGGRYDVPLPPDGQSADRFFDLSHLGETVIANINVNLPDHPWSKAYLLRQSNGIHIAVDSSEDDAIQRISKIYGKNRPNSADAQTILISDRTLERNQPGIWISESDVTGNTGGRGVVQNDITRNVRSWPAAGSAPMPAGFVQVVSDDAVAIVAARDDSTRQIWINADLHEWEKTPDFVVFFANALDWIGRNDQSYTSISPARLGGDWKAVEGDGQMSNPGEWPGIYQSTTGRLFAVNAGKIPLLSPLENSAAIKANITAALSISSMSAGFILAALACLLVSATIWYNKM